MKISIIVAMDENGGIGFKGNLPWHLRSDLINFKKLTMGHHIIMGRKTFESIGRALPGRRTIIVTRNNDYQSDDCMIAHSLQEAFDIARANDESNAFVIGGWEIYSQSLDCADEILLTRVHTVVKADTFFPKIDSKEWEVTEKVFHERDAQNEYDFTFYILRRDSKKTRKIEG